MSRKICKLNIYRHESEMLTIVEGVEAEDWGDFLIVHMRTDQMTPDIMNEMQIAFNGMDKRVLLIPKEWDVEFFGVEIYDDNEPKQA